MDEAAREQFVNAGVNMETALNRFMGNEKLLVRFLGKFHEDENYGKFLEAMREERYEDAFKAAHGLKGLCGNLSLDALYAVVCREVEFLRGDVQKEEAQALLPEIEEAYRKVIAGLSEACGAFGEA